MAVSVQFDLRASGLCDTNDRHRERIDESGEHDLISAEPELRDVLRDLDRRAARSRKSVKALGGIAFKEIESVAVRLKVPDGLTGGRGMHCLDRASRFGHSIDSGPLDPVNIARVGGHPVRAVTRTGQRDGLAAVLRDLVDRRRRHSLTDERKPEDRILIDDHFRCGKGRGQKFGVAARLRDLS